MARNEQLPFQRVWYDTRANWDQYKEILVTPVNTDHLVRMGWWDKVNYGGDNTNDAKELAAYTEQRIKDAFRQDPRQTLKVVEHAGPQTLVLEVALVELTPTKVWLNAIGYAGIMVPLDEGTVAIEGRLKDAGTGTVVAMFADREAGKFAPLSVANLTWYSHAKGVIDEWAGQLVAITNAEESDVIQDSWPFTLRPW